MDRLSQRYGYLAIALVLAATVLPATGCNVFTLVAYLAKGTDIPPAYPGLEGKKVVVVCRSIGDLSYRGPSVAKKVAREIGALLKKRVPKLELVDPREVEEFIDENAWDEFVDVGEAIDADVVVGVDLQNFSLYQSQILYQGKADAMVSIYECGGDGLPIFEKMLPQTLYPPNYGIPATETTEREFRQKFISVMADQIGRHFYAHDPGADFAMDAQALK
jgi:hypothetical protein